MSKGFRQAKSEAESLLRIVTIGSSPCGGMSQSQMKMDIFRCSLQPGEFRSGTRLAPVFRTQQILSSVFGCASPIAKNWRAP